MTQARNETSIQPFFSAPSAKDKAVIAAMTSANRSRSLILDTKIIEFQAMPQFHTSNRVETPDTNLNQTLVPLGPIPG